MIIVVDSLMGQGLRFAQKLEMPIVKISEYQETDSKILLLTRTYGFGEIPVSTQEFLDKFHQKVVGVAVSGNRNWGTNYGAAGDKIQDIYGIELVLKYEGSGLDVDVKKVKEWVRGKKDEWIKKR